MPVTLHPNKHEGEGPQGVEWAAREWAVLEACGDSCISRSYTGHQPRAVPATRTSCCGSLPGHGEKSIAHQEYMADQWSVSEAARCFRGR